MTTDKPSRNEDEYFVKQEAELLRKQRELADAAARDAERKSHYMKCPKDGYDLVSSTYHGVQIETCAIGEWPEGGVAMSRRCGTGSLPTTKPSSAT